ncbi:MAG: hypothetical protein JO359_12355 [Candidatus Eremiobacteraeota bacterium]|nr:hypothetical protein [Candidatus Eremiobacteraeota bacterium]
MAARDPRTNPLLNPFLNPMLNPLLNPALNPLLNASINPVTNPAINPVSNPLLSPATNPLLNPILNPLLNPLANPALNPSFNSSLRPSDEGSALVEYDRMLQPAGFLTSIGEQLFLRFEMDSTFAGLHVRNGVSGYNTFDKNNAWVGHLVLASAKDNLYLAFDPANVWQGVVV